jgi:hypothetical protein
MENENNVMFFKAPITGVMVYPSKARITRKVELEADTGVSVVAISDLPRNLNGESVKANISDESGVIVKSVNLKEYFEKKVSNEQLEKLDDELKELRRELSFLQNELLRLNKEFEDIKSAPVTPLNSGHEVETHSFLLNTKSWDDYLSHIVNKLGVNRSESREIMLKAFKLNKTIIKKEHEKSNLKFYLTKKTFGAEITIQSKEKVKTAIELNYIIYNASWFPVYDLRVMPDTEQAEIITYAVVKQGTGEDWNDVDIQFSTASPSFGTDIVKLNSWRIKRRDAQIVQSTAGAAQEDLELEMSDMLMEQQAVERKEDKSDMKKKRAKKKISMKQEEKKARELQAMKKASFRPVQQEGYDIEYNESADIDDETSHKLDSSLSKSMKSEINNLFMGGKKGRKSGFSPESLAQQSFQQEMKVGYHNMLKKYFMDDFQFDYSSFGRKTGSSRAKSYHKVSVDKASGGYDYRFSAVNKESILSTDEPYQVELKRDKKDIQLVNTVIPVEKTDAYMKALYKNDSDAPLLSGTVRVFIDTDYIGDSFINTVSSGEEVAFSMGVENDIKVVRREKSRRETSGFISKSTVIRFETEIELISYKNKQVKIEVFDRIPRSRQSDDITVYDDEYSIRPSEISSRGILIWNLELKKGESKKITYTYKVKHPEDFQLVMNRDFTPYREGE